MFGGIKVNDNWRTHGGLQLLGGSQVADSEWPPDMVVSCE